ncbi:type VI secretion system amidase effector protein Tae4 [Campylobacter troglodytis]|uniref:type VI secretion system amidase effector protein Tae4 n=1 Tax=Campylobacter troglodytis TaxID=654363 RepID=UPI001FE67698|nr:type VI secretion system amidase effector protein Tae4 [Campylobacter troglodytis]
MGTSEAEPTKKARLKYELVGGEPYDKFDKFPTIYEDTCALRMSYALNYGGMPLIKPTPNTKTYIVKDNKIYVLGSQDIRDFLYVKWKYEKPYNPKSMSLKAENIAFYDELMQFDKNGIVVMRIMGWGANAYGHTTLWNGKEGKFVDNSNFLLDIRDTVIVTQFYFWELK